MKIRMEIPDDLYSRYKEIAERQGFAVTKLNHILFKEAIENWIFKTEAGEIKKCESCGCPIGKGNGIYIVKNNEEEKDFYLWEKHIYCDDCWETEKR